jgi:hypothetical protein
LAGSYMQHLQLRKQLEERAKEAAKNRELAEKEQAALDQFMEECKENDVDVSEAEKPKLDLETAMASKDYEAAIGHARKAMETIRQSYLNKIGEVGDSVETLLNLIKSAGAESKSASDAIERSQERAEADDLEGAMKHAKSAYDSAERTLHEVFSGLFSQAQELIMQAKDMGDDISIFDDQLSKAKTALQNQEYEDCMTQIKEVLEGAGEDIKTEVNSTLSRAEELVSAGEEFDTDLSKVKNHIERARGHLDALRYKESLAYAKRAEAEGESAISSKLQELVKTTRDDIKKTRSANENVTVPQELLEQAQAALKEKKYIEAIHALNSAREKSNSIQFNSVLEVISHARDKFVLAKKVGVDMSKAITILNTSRDKLKRGKFEEAIEYAQQSEKEVDAVLDQFYKARDQMTELAKAVKMAADFGAEVTLVKERLTEARRLFEGKDYEKTAETAETGIAEANKMASAKAMEVIDSSDKAVKLGRNIGADITEAEGTLQKALDLLAKENLSESVELARSSAAASSAALTRVMSDKLQNIDQFISGSSGEAGLGEVGDLIAQARQSLASSEFERANNLIGQITQRIETIGEGECARVVQAARDKISALRSMGGNVDDLEILLTRADEARSRRVFEDATAQAKAILEQADEQILRMVQGEFSSVRDSVEEAKTIGIDIESVKIAIKDARAKADNQELEEAFKLVKSANDSLKAKIARLDAIKGKIRRTEDLAAEAGKTKVDTAGLLRKLDKARSQFNHGKLDDAERLLDECIAEAEKSLAMYLAAKFILSSKDRIDIAQANGIDIEEPQKLLAKAKDLMKQKKYEDALETAKTCDEQSKATITKSVSELVIDLQRLLADAKNVGVDTLGPEKLAEKATALARSGDFAEALQCIASAKDDINHIKSLSSKAALEIRVARGNLKDAETLDMDVGKATEFLDQAVEALTRHQYAIALELARKSSEISMEVSKTRIWDTLEKFRSKLEKSSADGRPLEAAERCVADGVQAFKEGRYQESLKMAMACEAEMERAELQHEITARAVELAKKKLADATAEGIRSDRLTQLVNKAGELFAAGKYVDAMTASIESGDELYLIRENMDGCRIEMSAVRERIERLKKIAINTSECDEIMDMAQDFLSAHEFVKCNDALKRAAAKAEALFENSIKDIMEQNKQMIAKANTMGINTKACEDMMAVANTSFQEKLWDFAYQQALACRSSSLDLISVKITTLIEEVQRKMAKLQNVGASTLVVEEIIEKARTAGSSGRISEAFQLLMDADGKLGTIEEAHKKYLDISIAAESAIDTLGRFGISKREPERLMAMAEIEREKDYDSCIELVAEALDTAKNLMESYSPDLTGSVSSRGLQEGVEGEMVVTVRNDGKALAKDVSVSVSGDFEVVESPNVPAVKPGTEEEVMVKLKPRRSGSVGVRVKLQTRRQYDGSSQTFDIEDAVNVFSAGPAFKLGRSVEQTRCISCQGRIKPGFDILTCRCGGQLHLSCAKRGGECPVCGQKYSL